MVSPTAVEKNGIAWARLHPVGTGPFKFSSFERDVSLKYVRFDDYWGGGPSVKQVRFRFAPEDSTRVAMLKTGEADLITQVPYPIVDEMKNTK